MLHGLYQWGRSRSGWTNRCGGLSAGPWNAPGTGSDQLLPQGLNLGLHVGDNPVTVTKNRQFLAQHLDRQLVWMNQVHGAAVQVITGATLASSQLTQPAEVDSLVWDTRDWTGPELAIAVQVADCVPVAVSDRQGRFLAVIHAGRAGVEKNVVGVTLETLQQLGATMDDLSAQIGPHICGKCYAVGPRLATALTAVVPGVDTLTSDGQIGVDLGQAVAIQLSKGGVCNILSTPLCTREEEQFYSYRRQKITGRQALVAYRE